MPPPLTVIPPYPTTLPTTPVGLPAILPPPPSINPSGPTGTQPTLPVVQPEHSKAPESEDNLVRALKKLRATLDKLRAAFSN